MYAHVVSLGVTGLDGYPVTVETHISGGLPKFAMVGLPDSAVKESSERVRSAIKNLNCPWPASHVTVNLAPADVRKTGSLYDLCSSAFWRRSSTSHSQSRTRHFWVSLGWMAHCAPLPVPCPWPLPPKRRA